ncbi:MAG: hypothetical protein K8W52_34930 [Deltaproteobacteria bacterium]|nr:hypothetical protein [Deltaproteobacteria bacterium]
MTPQLGASGVAGLAILLVAGPAVAGFEKYRYTADLTLEARGVDGAAGAIDAGPSLRATAGTRWLAYAIGLDVRPGGGRHGGFAFGAAFYPVGIALGAGAPVSARVVAGIGTDGVTGHVPFTARFPVEAELELHPIRAIELTLWCEAAWVTADRRAHGAIDGIGDEVTAGAALRIGRGKRERQQWHWSNGWRVGVMVQERVGERAWGLTLGYGIDVAFGPIRYEGV